MTPRNVALRTRLSYLAAAAFLPLALMSGIGLLGFLLHAGVDFPMRVPANAILACLLAGAFLRPLPPVRHPGGTPAPVVQ